MMDMGDLDYQMVLYDGLSSTHDEHLPRAPKTLSVGNFPNFEGVDGTIGDMIRMPLFRHGVVGTDQWMRFMLLRSQDPN